MESPRENDDGPSTPPANSHDRKVSRRNAKWSAEFNCLIVNGILAPIPLSARRTKTVVKDEQQEPTTTEQEESSTKKQKTEGNKKLFFKLYKFPAKFEQYLLEIHEVETSKVDRRHVIVSEKDGKWKVGIYNLGSGDYVVVPVVQDHSPPIFPKKYEISLEERLVGWTVEKRKRGNGKEDKFYYHYTRQFRSFVEMTTFILYSCKVKDLQMITNTIRQVHDAEAAEAMTIISSSDESESGSGHSTDDQ